ASLEQAPCMIGLARRRDGHHADAHVERAFQLGALDTTDLSDETEDRLWGPCRPMGARVEVRGQYPSQIRGQPATGHMRQRVEVDGCRQRKAILGVDAGRLDELLPPGSAALRD